jgi:hypothetical protein
MSNIKELLEDEICPCGSGGKYGHCCKKRGFRYVIDETNISKEIPMNQEIQDILKEQEHLFFEYYGRKPRNDKFLFSFMPVYNDGILLKTIHMFRQLGIDERKIYAYYKSDGLIPYDLNINLLTQKDLQEYEALCKEFDERMNSQLNAHMDVLPYVLLSNAHINEQIDYSIDAFINCLNDFLRRHSGTTSIRDYTMVTEVDYCMFSALKTIKVLQSLRELLKLQIPECIYALGRGIFENYMYLCAINKEPKLFQERLLPKLDEENYKFDVSSDGKINYRKIISRKTGVSVDVEPSNKELKKYLPNKIDSELYDLFYRTACQYVHVDIMSAKSYFTVTDPYDEIDPSLIAGLIVLVITSLLVAQIAKNSNVEELFQKDADYLCKNLNSRFQECLEMAICDPGHSNVIFDLLLHRLEQEGK